MKKNKKLNNMKYLNNYTSKKVELFDLKGNRVSLARTFDDYYLVNHHWKIKGVKFMKNRNFIVSLAFLGLAAQAFVLLSGKGLDPVQASMFTNASVIALFVAFILSVLSQRSECKINADREDIYRDIDAVYRHISDVNRDVMTDIRDLENEVNRRSKK